MFHDAFTRIIIVPAPSRGGIKTVGRAVLSALYRSRYFRYLACTDIAYTRLTMMPVQPILSRNAEILHPQFPRPSPVASFASLPTELRLKIWSRAVEPRVVLFGDLIQNRQSYPLPSVTQLNVEARAETRQGYEPIGYGSHFDFSRDILVCDHEISDNVPDPFLEELAPKIKRLAYWDCFPDDGRVDGPYHYSVYLSGCYRQRRFGQIEFDRFWFPNLEELWIVKIGEVDPTWMVTVDFEAPYEVRLRELAKQFRYWVDENIIEMAPLDLNDPEAQAVLNEGRCGKTDCHELNQGRSKMISKVLFLDGKYKPPSDGSNWVRIMPWHGEEQPKEKRTYENKLRWVLVERILTFDLRWDGSNETGWEIRHRRREIRDKANPVLGELHDFQDETFIFLSPRREMKLQQEAGSASSASPSRAKGVTRYKQRGPLFTGLAPPHQGLDSHGKSNSRATLGTLKSSAPRELLNQRLSPGELDTCTVAWGYLMNGRVCECNSSQLLLLLPVRPSGRRMAKRDNIRRSY
ncbi:hypothetical protein G7046_g8565 [Stylonectria norvegica]|nr:hypothetical protein G7046_g8565 [Stylonectria norvegica]